ncbi:transporter family-2 protein [Sphingomonas gellani]|uniref:Transporter family-2 protein n=1 Tax=Sphingomonas gellani TaxID=1166340 RepID=A0A1H8BC96_9SPHN|nr:DMT family transporter [Sphingomonas gellani]SEM80505.1 transporter family-2 protein [Sphingomonas gellani]
MTSGLLFSAIAFVGGILLAVQAPTNALVGRAAGSPLMAALISFAVGIVALGAMALATGTARWTPEMRALPPYVWLGGLYGAFFVAAAAFLAPRIGAGALLTAAIAGQLLAGLVLDRYGLLGLPRHDLSLPRIAGAVLVLAGAALVGRS